MPTRRTTLNLIHKINKYLRTQKKKTSHPRWNIHIKRSSVCIQKNPTSQIKCYICVLFCYSTICCWFLCMPPRGRQTNMGTAGYPSFMNFILYFYFCGTTKTTLYWKIYNIQHIGLSKPFFGTRFSPHNTYDVHVLFKLARTVWIANFNLILFLRSTICRNFTSV